MAPLMMRKYEVATPTDDFPDALLVGCTEAAELTERQLAKIVLRLGGQLSGTSKGTALGRVHSVSCMTR
ncbi:hypothetical protein HYQ44_000683 [Verticillium longisporum]|nr:hypothetical protein HYQ44_000683 [Verticillium longisporum]